MIRSSRFLFRALLAAGACLPAFAQGPDVWMKLYNEKDFDGWKGKMTIWKVDTGAMMTGTGALNTTNYEVSGYQYELSDGGTGAFYHERGNEIGFTGGCGGSGPAWKKMEVIANGPKVTHKLNGVNSFEYSTFKVLEKGIIGLQLHNPGNVSVNFKNVFIKPLNNSFQIPSDNAWDGAGNKIGPLETRIQAKVKTERINALFEIPGAMVGYDIQGKALPHVLMNRSPAILIITR